MKSVLITGCSDGGIGSALAITFAQRGLLVFAATRNVSKMSKLENLTNVHLLALDITEHTQVRNAVEIVKKATGGTLDYLVNNAAQVRFMPILDEPEGFQEARKQFDINLWAQMDMVQAFAPLLIEAKGTLVYNSSAAAHGTAPWLFTYAASKKAAEIMFDTLRIELAPFGVKVTTIVTTPVHSEGFNNLSLHQWAMPENSRYAEVREMFAKQARDEGGPPRMETIKYAEGVVSKLLQDKPAAKFWYGGNAGIIKFMITWFPTSWLDWILMKNSGIDEMLKKK